MCGQNLFSQSSNKSARLYFALKSYSSLATLVESEYVYSLTNLNIETYHVLAVLDVLLRRNANEPLEVGAKVTLADKSSFNSDTLDRMPV
jgi:hypothetical protein